MIILVIDVYRILAFESERDAPVTTDAHRPSAASAALQWMKPEARKAHVAWGRSRIQSRQNHSQTLGLSGLDPGLGPGRKELPQALVTERADHGVKCNP